MHMIGVQGNGADGVHLGDIDGDGFPDIVSGWEESGDLMLYLNPGAAGRAAQRWPAVDISAGLRMRGVEDAAFADLDCDGSLDSVVSSVEGCVQRLAVHRPHGPLLDASAWQAEVLAPEGSARYVKARAGCRLPGSVDIVAGSREGGSREAGIYRFQRGAEGWASERLGAVDFKTTGLLSIDVDGDGWLDVLFAGRGEVAWLRNPGSTITAPWTRHLFARNVSEFAVCDLDRDGHWDLVAGTSRHSGIVARWFRRNSAGGWEYWPIAIADGRPGAGSKFVIKGVACGDLDGDGTDELVFSASGTGHGIFSLAHSGKPASNAPWSIRYHVGWAPQMKYDNVELADIDGDGDLDIVTTEEGAGTLSLGLGVLWLENPLIGGRSSTTSAAEPPCRLGAPSHSRPHPICSPNAEKHAATGPPALTDHSLLPLAQALR
jgi:hypothetical protein